MRLFLCLFLLFSATLYAGETETAKTDSSIHQVTFKPSRDNWLGKDKVDHFMVSAFLTGFSYYAARNELERSEVASRNGSIVFAVTAGISKELYDAFSRKGRASYKDFVADVLGIGFGLVLLRIGE
jgi:uncharacterized protein YfiM (DUF2279 family)